MEVVRQISFDYSAAIQVFYILFTILLKVLQVALIFMDVWPLVVEEANIAAYLVRT